MHMPDHAVYLSTTKCHSRHRTSRAKKRFETKFRIQNFVTRIAYFPYQPEDLVAHARRLRIVSHWKLTKFLSVTLAHKP